MSGCGWLLAAASVRSASSGYKPRLSLCSDLPFAGRSNHIFFGFLQYTPRDGLGQLEFVRHQGRTLDLIVAGSHAAALSVVVAVSRTIPCGWPARPPPKTPPQ